MSQTGSMDTTSEADFLDCYNVAEIFCEALARVEQVGSVRRLIFVIHQTEGRRRVRSPVVKLVLPAEALADIAQMLAADVRMPKALAALSTSALAN
jgi:hypothetical protein